MKIRSLCRTGLVILLFAGSGQWLSCRDLSTYTPIDSNYLQGLWISQDSVAPVKMYFIDSAYMIIQIFNKEVNHWEGGEKKLPYELTTKTGETILKVVKKTPNEPDSSYSFLLRKISSISLKAQDYNPQLGKYGFVNWLEETKDNTIVFEKVRY